MAKKEWKKSKVIYWSDEKHDDFDQTCSKRPEVPKDYNYLRNNFLKNIFYNLLYYGVAVPLIGLWMRILGIKIKNKKNLKLIKGKGAFIYSNHVALSDVTKFQTLVFPFRRVNILGYSDSLAIPVARRVIKALGYLPLPLKGDLDNMIKLNNAFKYYTNEKKQLVLIFPEAHIWPYYTKVRNFGYGSFYYPSYANVPALPIVTTWRKVWYSKKAKQTLIVGKPIYPKTELDTNENKIYLHDECLKQMQQIADETKQYEYIKYIHQEKEKNDNIL